MADLNTVTLIGRATKDTELRTTPSGSSIATVSIANNSSNDRASYFDVVFFDKTAEIASKYVNKGKEVGITGRLQQRQWQDKQGNNRYSVEIVGHQLQLLGGKNDGIPTSRRERDVVLEDIDDDKEISLEDIPF